VHLHKSEAMLSDAQALAGLGWWELDPVTGSMVLSAELFQIAGRAKRRGALMVGDFAAMLHPDDRDVIRDQLHSALECGNGHEAEFRLVRPDGQIAWIHSRTKVVLNEGQPARVYGTVLDITDRKESERVIADFNILQRSQLRELEAVNQRLEELSFTDGLTGLHNHRAFQERLIEEYHRARRHKKKLSVVMIDVDLFKEYNDEYGHPAGDEVLKAVAATIGACMRNTDLAARYGGEEFVLILPQTGLRGAVALADRIRKRIENREWSERKVTISAGCACLGRHAADGSSLLALADRALYESKSSGRNRVSAAHNPKSRA